MTINDVAKIAGVSRGSVSNYLNNRKVSDKIRAKIEKAIAELNYVPSAAARDLRAQDSHFVIFIIPTIWSPLFSEFTYHVQDELSKKNYKMILCISNHDFEKEKEYLAMAESQKAAGVISVSYSQMNLHAKPGMPLISIEREPSGRFPMISSDNYQGGRLAAEKLQNSGCEHFIFIGEKEITSNAMGARQAGFIDYCMENHLDAHTYKVGKPKNRTEMDSELREIFSQESLMRNAGIFAITDEYAQIAYDTLIDMGISVPQHVQIIGFDGSKSTQNEMSRLSSIRQPIEEMARESVEALEKYIAQAKNQELIAEVPRIYLPVSFQEGRTTRKAK
ncbi:LacI family DNA-binding transcriptional regulator [Lactococcus piscium]|nr:LacI family DNA-binding transcriptional regulator [Lactococcus carnosus]MCJ1972291.1 LacI family DNA-binding transcriptional regulator [Lactococcus carnosus]